ncbi:MAG: FtsX-like permease family protein [Mucinivorans sp.]
MKQILLALRTLRHYKLYSTINILGLAMSLACAIVIGRYVYREMTVDGFNSRLDRIYCSTVEMQNSQGKQSLAHPENPNNDKEYIDPFVGNPLVEKVCAYVLCPDEPITIDHKEQKVNMVAADSTFFDILDYELLLGSKPDVLRSKSGAIVSERFAREQFTIAARAMGRTITVLGKELIVEGVVGEPSSKSLLNFDVLVSYHMEYGWSQIPRNFVLASVGATRSALNTLSAKYMAMSIHRGELGRFQYVPLKGLYFDKELVGQWNGSTVNVGDRNQITVLSIVALLLLVVGVLNFVNIYTVVMLRRGREIGVKKVFGASTSSIVGSILIENVAMIALATGIGWVIIYIFRPIIVGSLALEQTVNLAFDLGLTAALIVVLPLVTSIYPYFKYRYAQAITSLREVDSSRRSIVARAVLMVTQYTVTVVLIVVSIYFMRQLNFLLSSDLGITTQNVISAQFLNYPTSYAPITDDDAWEKERQKEEENVQYIENEMSSSPLFSAWSYSDLELRGNNPSRITFTTPEGKSIEVGLLNLSSEAIKMFGLRVEEGEGFSPDKNKFAEYTCLVTKGTLKALGIKDYTSARLQPNSRLWWSADADCSGNPPYTVQGVVNDFATSHLGLGMMPMVITSDGKHGYRTDKLMAHIVPGREKDAIAFLGNLHQKVVGGQFNYSMLEDDRRAMYAQDKKVATVYSVFALIAILISSLGLFSLSLYDTQRRVREIALRRVNGAKVGQIVRMLLSKYYLLLSISFVVAMPLAYMAARWYMRDFAVHASLSWWIFVVAGVLTAGISLLTLIVQTIKAANTNPAITMKRE